MDNTVAMARTRLVLVEDHRDQLEVLSIILREQYAVFGYASAAEALQAIEAAKPDVLVLDIAMHPIDGVQCLEAIRALPGYRAVPAVALTGYGRDADQQRFLEAGFQAVVVKPILKVAELTAVIDGLGNSPAPALRTAMHPSAAAAQLDVSAATGAPNARGSDEADAQGPV